MLFSSLQKARHMGVQCTISLPYVLYFSAYLESAHWNIYKALTWTSSEISLFICVFESVGSQKVQIFCHKNCKYFESCRLQLWSLYFCIGFKELWNEFEEVKLFYWFCVTILISVKQFPWLFRTTETFYGLCPFVLTLDSKRQSETHFYLWVLITSGTLYLLSI